ncbi:ABC transporter permease subunit, partial [Pseudomonas fluorescens]
MNYQFDLFFIANGLWPLLKGLVVTLELTIAANLIGLTLGFVIALLVMSPNPILRWPFTLFIEFFRCTPALVQIVWFFYCIPIIFDVYI